MFWHLFAQYGPPVYNTPKTPSGGSAINPGEWAKLADQLGPTMFMAIFCLAALVAFIILGGFIAWRLANKFLPKLFDRADKFLNDIVNVSDKNAESLRLQVSNCKVTRTNIGCLCDAGHIFADAICKVGNGLNVDLEEECRQIHEKLKTVITVE